MIVETVPAANQNCKRNFEDFGRSQITSGFKKDPPFSLEELSHPVSATLNNSSEKRLHQGALAGRSPPYSYNSFNPSSGGRGKDDGSGGLPGDQLSMTQAWKAAST